MRGSRSRAGRGSGPRADRRRARRGSTPVVLRAARVSLAAGIAVLLVKLGAWWVSGSTALLGDALESTVNVLAAGFAAYAVAIAARPADADHPYGHGKAEFLSAGVEGGMILAAAVVVAIEAVQRLREGPELVGIAPGALLGVLAGAGNAVLGAYLIRTGRAAGSPALEADGRHVLADVVTTAGALLGLAAVAWTGQAWIDPLAALAVAAYILVTGARVLRSALGGLLDEADFSFLERISDRLRAGGRPEWIEIHQLRTWRSGSFRHIDLHVVVPRYLTIDEGHRAGDALERELLEVAGGRADVVVHVDPCRPLHCPRCRVADCPVRGAPFERGTAFDVPALTREGNV
jgi:cation diffusion facilitator family transporter